MPVARALSAVSALVTLPAVLAHEATHAALTAPHADTWTMHVSLGGAAVIVEDWDVDAPRWGIVLAHLGPMLAGLLLGVAALAYIGLSGYDPATTYDWLKVSILAIWWGIYTAPSGGDLAILEDTGGGRTDAAE